MIQQPVSSTQLKVSISVANMVLNPWEFTNSKYHPICFAAFGYLQTSYKADKFSITKGAPKLTPKACWPETYSTLTGSGNIRSNDSNFAPYIRTMQG